MMTENLQNVAPSSPARGRKGIILFVHGFVSAADTWGKMIELLEQDPRIKRLYEFATYSYATKLVELNPLARIPELKELGEQLAGEIDSPRYHGRSLTLVGHSQGGLVIQSYFTAMANGKADALRDIRQAIFFATPSEGSSLGSAFRSFFFRIFSNEQERTLRVHNSQVAEIRKQVRERIVDADADTANSWRIPIHSFYGMRDNIVPAASATSVFGNTKALDGTHTTVHQPEHTLDRRYTEFVEVLLDPGGHVRRFEVEQYRNILRVEPGARPSAQAPDELSGGREFDNKALLTRSVKFARSNRNQQPFRIMFDVRKGAHLSGRTSHPNEVPAEERGRAEDTGAVYDFRFRPATQDEYTAWLDLYNAFGDGRRNIHFHLHSYNSHLRALSYELDLSAYLTAGYSIPEAPECRYSPALAPTCDFCDDIRMHPPLPITHTPRKGVYQWEFSELEGGVVDILWKVTEATDHERNR